MRYGSVLVVAALLMAGCSDAPTEATQDQEPEAFKEVEATLEKGVIRGVVVDQNVMTIAGASIRLEPGSLNTTSKEDGSFSFGDLEPATYFLFADAPGHESTQTSVEVVAGIKNPDVVRMMMNAIPVPDPYFVPQEYTGFITVGAWGGPGLWATVWWGLINTHSYQTTKEIDVNATWVQSESIWTPGSELAKRLWMNSNIQGGDGATASQGSAGDYSVLHAYNETQAPGTTKHFVQMLVWGGGDLPIGLAVDQDFTIYTHSFHNMMPVDGWRFGTDGEHPQPDQTPPGT